MMVSLFYRQLKDSYRRKEGKVGVIGKEGGREIWKKGQRGSRKGEEKVLETQGGRRETSSGGDEGG